jgi:cell division protein FtsZ
LNENSLDISEESDKSAEPSVRRLSLFDTLSSDKSESFEDNENISNKSEPILSSNDEIQNNSENLDENINPDNSENEFNPEEGESNEIDEEFNQETEEELLDIPTFLRRQAN